MKNKSFLSNPNRTHRILIGNIRHKLILLVLVLLSFCSLQILTGQSLGDVNNNGAIDIVDALLVAQYYVGLNPSNFNSNVADVNAGNGIDIVDALLIAQYYVGLITVFPGQNVTPVATAIQTQGPTTPPGSGYYFSGTLTNGLIDGAPVSYATTASFDGTNVTITFDGGTGFEWVWCYTPDYHNMTNTGGNTWSITISGYMAGSTLQYYFTVRKNSQEANNSGSAHVWTVVTDASVTPVPTTVVTPGPTSEPGGYTLVWSDDFTNGIGSDWVFETGNGSSGWGNNELEYYRQENATVSNGELVITAKKESYGGFNYTSARMKTQGKKSWTYGKVEARIKLSMGQGIWPAFWMLGDNISSVNWPACGEIDIMEHINSESQIHTTIHWDQNGHVSYGGPATVDVTQYHVYAIEWNTSAIKWYVDGSQCFEANILDNINGTEEFHRPFFILLNLAVGGAWPGNPDSSTVFPATMYVDYVRVYQ
jgi:beta-glucanase (GH16 family)